jgi:hypothetical protein
LTTLAIIGGGIAGRSLLYNLTSSPFSYEKVLLFDSDVFSPTCSLRSTAIVARRGVTKGHSGLGDLLYDSFDGFREHVIKDAPAGVFPIIHYTGALTKIKITKQRYPEGEMSRNFGKEMYLSEEAGFLLEPQTYLDWLLSMSMQLLPLECMNEFVTQIQGGRLLTQSGKEFIADQVVFCCGGGTRFWRPDMGKVVQGAYLEFNQVDWSGPSFSLTLDGDNLIYHQKRVLVGSSSWEVDHLLSPLEELHGIYQRISAGVSFELPPFALGEVRVGQREKARKRRPYCISEGVHTYIGGLYKNGFTLGLEMTRNVAHRRPSLA